MDLAELTARGLPDAEIARRLELRDENDIAILRARYSEFQHV
jgi:DNA-binding CsgD family transcriptional regulator